MQAYRREIYSATIHAHTPRLTLSPASLAQGLIADGMSGILWKRSRSSWQEKADELAMTSPVDTPAGSDPDSDGDSDAEELAPDDHSREFYELLVSLKMQGTLSAKQTCRLSFYARGAGLAGVGGELAMGLGRTGGNDAAHLTRSQVFSEAIRSDF